MARSTPEPDSEMNGVEVPSSESSLRSPPPREASPETPARKRKRDAAPTDELEIDVNLPEPPSRRERRKAKKAKVRSAAADAPGTATTTTTDPASAPEEAPKAPRSPHGIWIGNLPWTATKPALRQFLLEQTGLPAAQITRIHLPAPRAADAGAHRRVRPLNQGFAYVDFASAAARRDALLVSEALLDGRRVLVKASTSFDGRPETHGASRTRATLATGGAAGAGAEAARDVDAKPPNRRVFVGNLGYEVSRADLEEHYRKCGAIELLHMATFEDSGKCKGFAWVTFAELEAARDAVKGWTMIPADRDSEDEDGVDENGGERAKKPKKKMRKWFVNRLHGRTLRCEFAEDATTRYKKRFGKGDAAKDSTAQGETDASGEVDGDQASHHTPEDKPRRRDSARKPREKVDARDIRPGAAHFNAKRASQAIVAGTGKKITFD